MLLELRISSFFRQSLVSFPKLKTALESLCYKFSTFKVSLLKLKCNDIKKDCFSQFFKNFTGVVFNLNSLQNLIGLTIRNSKNPIKHFSVPYECIFHLGCIGFSVNVHKSFSSKSSKNEKKKPKIERMKSKMIIKGL